MRREGLSSDDRVKRIAISALILSFAVLGIHVDKVLMKQRRASFLGARVPINPSEDAQKFGQLDILGKQENIVDFLRIIEPDLKSLSSVAMGDSSLIHGDIGLSRKIPVAYMGDGAARLLSVILAIASSQNGTVFIDECENGIHYSAMPKVWEAIAKAAREYDCQIIEQPIVTSALKLPIMGCQEIWRLILAIFVSTELRTEQQRNPLIMSC